MKTIKERAEEYADECWTLDEANFACEDGYIKGATEQQAIDIDKACEWMKSHIDEGLVIYHNNTWCSLGEFIKNFRKAMKGE